jgi:hypothetical protein
MKHFNTFENLTKRHALSSVSVTAIAVASMLSLPQPVEAHDVTPPSVPVEIQVPAGNVAFLRGKATGTQNYACSPSGTGFAWILFTPEATLFNKADKQIITHFFGPNPDPNDVNTDPRVLAKGTIRAAWQARDTSTVWAKVSPLSRPIVVRPDSIPWLLLETVGVQEGPTGGDTLTPTTFIQRVNTFGGLAPSTGCSQLADVGKKAFVPYTADYFFFAKADAVDSY